MKIKFLKLALLRFYDRFDKMVPDFNLIYILNFYKDIKVSKYWKSYGFDIQKLYLWKFNVHFLQIKSIICILLLFFQLKSGSAQDSVQINFKSPLDIPLLISANYGDIRNNSFHFGLDLRTDDKEGLPVFAVADGYVSRIKIEPGGYGRAIYINHPNGTTSVYGHLKAMYDSLAKFVRNEQYLRQSFFIDMEFKPEQFKIKQGTFIGLSGNAGLSSGPHLHFEIRDSKTQNTLNSFQHEFQIKDTLKPVFTKLWIYPILGYIPEENYPKKSYNIKGKNGNYFLKKEVIPLPQNFGFGIEAFDFITDTFRKLSFYSLKLFKDSVLLFETVFDRMSFEEVGFVNSSIDYELKSLENINVYRQFLWPNQELQAYKTFVNNGTIFLSDNKKHYFRFIAEDKSGNTSTFEFYGQLESHQIKNDYFPDTVNSILLKWNKRNIIENKFIKIDIPVNSLYDDMYITTDTFHFTPSISSFAVRIGNNNKPVKKIFTISIPSKIIDDSLKSKLLICSIDKHGKTLSIGGSFKNGNVTANTKTFGGFCIMADTIPPKITPVNIWPGKNMSDEDFISIKIKDNLSGIDTYRGTIDKKWVLFEYDAKYDLLTYTFDPERFNFKIKKHLLLLKVTDKKGNYKLYKLYFYK